MGDVGGGEVRAGAVPARGTPPPAGGVTGDADAEFHHQLGCHRVTSGCSRLPYPAENDYPVHGRPHRPAMSRSATSAPARRARVVVRPTYCRRPSSSNRPGSSVRGAVRER
ncbi:hypothetical protein ACFQ1B_00285 [Streptomyces mexicanus]